MGKLFYISDLMIADKTLCMKEILEIYVHYCFDKIRHFHLRRVASGLTRYRSTQQAKQTNVIRKRLIDMPFIAAYSLIICCRKSNFTMLFSDSGMLFSSLVQLDYFSEIFHCSY